MDKLTIIAEEVLADIRSAAWLESELHSEIDRHGRHEMADICEKGNIERVWRVLGISVAEVRVALQKILCQEKQISRVNVLEEPESWNFTFLYRLSNYSISYIKEKTHEYLVSSVMADRTSVIIPTAADVWRFRAETALSALRTMASTKQMPCSRVRRPLSPF